MERWMHDSLDIICFGRSYWQLHREIDKEARELGIYHRIYKHDWYWKFKKLWDFENPFPVEELDKGVAEIFEAIPWKLRTAFKTIASGNAVSSSEKEGVIREAFQVYVCHCFWDRIWDDYSYEERQWLKRVVMEWILSPQLLYKKADVDVIEGKVKVKDNGEQWEHSVRLKQDYANLVRIVHSELNRMRE